MKIKSVSEGISRLNDLAKKIDDLISEEESMMPEGVILNVITGEDQLAKFKHQTTRYIKFGLVYRSGSLEEDEKPTYQ